MDTIREERDESIARALAGYYAKRAREYEQVYDKPERQFELTALRQIVAENFTGAQVLEIACGTGYWTAAYAPFAKSVLATDIGDEVLSVARAKGLAPDRVVFSQADAFALQTVAGDFNAGFVGFWWSHVLLNELDGFLRALHARLGAGARAMMIDNRYVEGSNHAITRVDDAGNSFQERTLADGSRHEVLKNFPDAHAVASRLAECGASDIVVEVSEHFWWATYVVRGVSG